MEPRLSKEQLDTATKYHEGLRRYLNSVGLSAIAQVYQPGQLAELPDELTNNGTSTEAPIG